MHNLGFFQSTLVTNNSHSKITLGMIKGGRSVALAVILWLLGENVVVDEMEKFVLSKWEVFGHFKTNKFGDSFRIHFKSTFDFERVRLVDGRGTSIMFLLSSYGLGLWSRQMISLIHCLSGSSFPT